MFRAVLPGSARRGHRPLRTTVVALLTGALALAAPAGVGTAAAVPFPTVSAASVGTSGGTSGATSDGTSDGTDYTELVDPFVSTAGDDGNDLPGAQAPHGLAKVNPMTTPNRNHSGYDYDEDHIAGFTATDLDGVGGSGGGGDLLVVPTSVRYDKRPSPSTYAHAYGHDDETATPGSYQVGLGAVSGTASSVTRDSGTVEAEVTATTRTALERYDFPSGSDPELVLDLANNFTSRTRSTLKATTLPDGTTSIGGLIAGSFNGASYKLYYAATTNVPVTSLKSWGDDGRLSDTTTQDGSDTGAVLGFDRSTGDDIELRVTLSPISAEQAATDQRNEVGDLTFDQARARTRADWNRALGAVDVHASATSDPGSTLTREFYTHLYRMYALPVNATSTSGTYRGVDGAVHKTNGYTYYDGWSTWDDFRKYSVEAYIDPAAYRDMVQSLIELFADAHTAGKSPGSLTHSVPTVRWERSAVLVADALSKGYENFDRLDEAYPALMSYSGYYTGAQLRQGYVTGDPGTTVQRGYDQWALSVIAGALGKKADAQKLRAQSTMAIDNLVKSGAWTAGDGTEVGLLTPRAAGGDWQSADHEKFEAAGLYQGTLWQYHWYDAYDMGGLIEAMGGVKAGKAAVEHMFGEDSGADDGSAMLHSNANEIDLQAPYLFNYVGEPSLTQKWVRAIYTGTTWNRYIATGSSNEVPSSGGEFRPPVKTRVYKLSPRGFLPTMDNDAGTMSTMFVGAALGLFPVTAGSSQFQIGSPFFDSTTIRYANGARFTVKAEGVSPDHYYVQSATLNGSRFDNTWLDYSQIVAGGTLDFTMGSEPSRWGARTEPAYSLDTDPGDTGGGTGPARGDTVVSAAPGTVGAGSDGGVDGALKLTLAGPAEFAARKGTSLTRSGAATVTGLPGGVTADLRVSGSRTATLSLTGSTRVDARFGVTFQDAAFAHGVRASTVHGTGVSPTDPLVLSAAAVHREALGALVGQAVPVREGNYSDGSWNVFRSALDRARTVLADTASATGTIMAADDALRSAVDALTIDEGGFAVLQAEDPDQKEGPSLVSEAYYSDGDLGGVTEGSWERFTKLDFGGVTPRSVSVRYANSQVANARPSSVDIHAGAADGPVVATVQLPGTGGWQYYSTVRAAVTDPDALLGASSATFVFHAPSGQQWVSNFDRYQFSPYEVSSEAGAPVAFDATAFRSNSGGGLKSEPVGWSGSGSTTDLGGTYDGAWLDYGDIGFGDSPKSTVTITYVNNSARCGTGSAVQLYLDSFDAGSPGTPYATVPLPVTGAAWSSGGTTSLALPEAITGTHSVHLRLVTTPDSSHPYVANLGRITFAHVETPAVTDRSALRKAIDRYAGLSGDTGRYDTIDFGVYRRELAAARALADADAVTQLEVDTQTRGLTLAARQLIPLPRLRLENLVATASALDDARYTDTSWTAFTEALAEARAAVADTAATDETLTARYDALDHARGALTTKPKAVPAAPDAVSAISSGTSVTVAWAAPGDTGGSPVTGYEVTLDDGHRVEIHDPDSRRTTFTRLRAGRSYTARVRAVNAVGTSHPSPATAPVVTGGGKPQTPVVTGVITDGRQVRVTWRAGGDGGFPVIGYTVALDDGTTAHVPATTATTLLTAAGRAKAHTATVTAVTPAGTSADSAAPASGTTAAAPDASDPAYAPSPFPDDTLNAAYPSDSWPTTGDGSDYFDGLLSGADDLRTDVLGANTKVPNGTSPTAENDRAAVAINNSATQKEVDRAEVDATHSATVTLADGLGSRLGRIYGDALSGGLLPKTSALFSRITKGLDHVDAAKNHYGYQRPYVRLGFVGDGGQIHESQDGSYGSLATSGSYPSGHTYGGYEAGTVLATLLPELAPSILARTSEYGDNRVVLGFHYPLDVMGGRITGQATVAHRWADPDFRKLLTQAHTEIENVLLAQCGAEGYGDTLTACAGDPYSGLSTAQDVDLYTRRLTYGFSQVAKAGQTLRTPADAAALLITAFPDLTTEQRVQVLEQTATDSGYPLDLTADGGASWQRINLAAAMAAQVVVGADGSVTVTNSSDATGASVADAGSITVGGVAIDGFDAEVSTYVVDWPRNKRIPAVSAVPARSGARVRVTEGGSVLSSAGSRFTTRTVRVTSANGSVTRTYTVGFRLTARDDRPVSAGGRDREAGGPGSWSTGGGGAGSAGGARLWSPGAEWAERVGVPGANGTP
ncbi:glycoside hydrolase domain-containing protein [Streptomyces sp. NPDC127066]|uniref:glycoside hydrolase domain-containing protein n=1 Tax=Streptomyces sp. NPDC127066 TaxID=3347125 RepID=UPI0036498C99